MLLGSHIVCGGTLLFFLISFAKLYLCCGCRFGFLYVCSSCLGSMLAFMFVFWFCYFGFVDFAVWIFLDRQVVALLLLLWFPFWLLYFCFISCSFPLTLVSFLSPVEVGFVVTSWLGCYAVLCFCLGVKYFIWFFLKRNKSATTTDWYVW
jgi:hypothetical protein